MEKSANSDFRTVRGYQLQNQREGRLTPALEDYLEMTCRLCGEDGFARVGKLSDLLNVRPSSASKMLSKLAALGYLKYDRYEMIRMTEAGRQAGEYLLYRHETVRHFLSLLGSDDPLQETELIEHTLSPQTVADLQVMNDFFEQSPEVQTRFRAFQAQRKQKTKP
jgi:Mn-dependent DtxR family transcriptional regulator